jgi:hypothetical protein
LFFSFDHPSKSSLTTGEFPSHYRYNPSFDSDYDRVVAMAKRSGKNQTRIHRLKDNQGTHYGFIALSVALSDNKPCLVIDYLFVSQKYRGVSYPELENRTIASILISFAGQVATEANKNFPLRYIALVPANDKLEKYYAELGYRKLDLTNFMYFKLKH